ncbi:MULTISPECIES: hypothetical protein [unclassified Maridesulfovibrio]|uniref:hypothetical protein n=1 Tax=unclassified Maridesulfovibrio TaxID=2794999 RepID=UPI003B3CD573
MPKELTLEDLTKAELIILIREKSGLNLIRQWELLHARWMYLREKSIALSEVADREMQEASDNNDTMAIVASCVTAEKAHKIWIRADKYREAMNELRSY